MSTQSQVVTIRKERNWPRRWGLHVDGKLVMHLEIHEDGGVFESEKNRPTGDYAIFWDVNDVVTVEKMTVWEKEIIVYFRGGCAKDECNVLEPARVDSLYGYRGSDGEWHHKQLIHFLCFNSPAPDQYDCDIHEVHRRFVAQEHIGFISHDIDYHAFRFGVQADVDVDQKKRLLFNFDVPCCPDELLTKIFMETSLISVTPEAAAKVMKRVQTHVQKLYNRP